MKLNKAGLLCFLILLMSSAYAVTAPDVNEFSATWDRSYIKNGSITFTFSVLDLDVNGLVGSADLNAQIWLTKDYNFNHISYLGDWNLMGGGAKFATCTVTDFNVGSSCSITYTLNETIDGNYWFDLNVYSYEPGAPTVVIDSKWVRSQDGGSANDLNFYIDNTAPTAVTDLTAKDNRNKSITLNWKALSSVTPLTFASFKTYYSNSVITTCTAGTLDTTSTSGTLITDNIASLTAGQNYWFCVLVTDVAGNATNSAIVFSPVTDEVIGGIPLEITEEQKQQVAEAVGAQAGAIGSTNVFGTMIPTGILLAVAVLIVGGLLFGGNKVRKKKKKK